MVKGNLRRREFVLTFGSWGARVHHDREARWHMSVKGAGAGSWKVTSLTANKKQREWRGSRERLYILRVITPQSAVLSPAWLHLPNLPNNWGPSVQTPESMGDISHANHHTNGPLVSHFHIILVFLLFSIFLDCLVIDLFKEPTFFTDPLYCLFFVLTFIYVYLFISCIDIHKPWNTCGNQRTTCSLTCLSPNIFRCIIGLFILSLNF